MRFPNKPLLLAHVLGMLILTAPAAAAHASGPATTATIPSDAITTARTITALNLRPEPNTTRPPIAVIPGGATIDVLGRNNAATWLFAVYQGQQGWVSAYYVVLASSTPSDLPIVSPSGTPTTPTIPTTPATTFSPYIHNITPHARQIYLDGQAKGNHADVFSKVGDSITVSWAFLNKIGDGIYALNDYGYLQPAVTYFSGAAARTGNSFNNTSLAAVEGWTSADLLDPSHAAAMCPGLSPLACEYSLVRPSVAIIMIGTNDANRWLNRGAFAANLGQIVQTSIDYGVIPVLSTIPHNSEADVQPYNEIIVATAVALDVPWMDFYAASANLPDHGNDPDGVHPSVPPTHDPTHFTAETLQYGFTVRNLLALHMLDAVWRLALTP
jgi:uncharacterized protein YraI